MSGSRDIIQGQPALEVIENTQEIDLQRILSAALRNFVSGFDFSRRENFEPELGMILCKAALIFLIDDPYELNQPIAQVLDAYHLLTGKGNKKYIPQLNPNKPN
jgi:hypothetical protein